MKTTRAEMESPETGSLAEERPRLRSVFFLVAWCGLLAGLLEVAAMIFRKQFFDINHLYGISRQFTWQLPVTNLCLFVLFWFFALPGLIARSRRGWWIFSRILCALTLLPMLLVGFSQIYSSAWVVVALGVAARLVPVIERRRESFRRFVVWTLPLLIGSVLVFGMIPILSDRQAQSRENAQPLPPPGVPNVLLIVMDTVAAGHSSLSGYERPTTSTLVELAEQGVVFYGAQSSAPWTLPSHASMFTGRSMHELGVGWLTPLGRTPQTVAEFLRSRGYATAGFVANTPYAASDSGLNRGFTLYSDYIFPKLTVFKRTALVSRVSQAIQTGVNFLDDQFEVARLKLSVGALWLWLDVDRKPAAVVNRELLDWLARRPQPERPFFAFLNYFDAHYPYQLPAGRFHRFGGTPVDNRQVEMIEHWGELDKSPLSADEIAFGAKAYDDCIADLDEQIGILLDRLRRRGVLEHTWVIVTADHGESFGEHAGTFCHGTSLYQTEVHVPLVIVPPGGKRAKQVVTDAVSLRDLAATIVDVTGQKGDSPFPGDSLARYWDETTVASERKRTASSGLALAEVVPNPNAPGKRDSSGPVEPNFPLGALKEAEWTYIRREKELDEKLFHLRTDAKEEHDLSSDPAMQATLERLRAALGRMTGGPLVPGRFAP